MNDMLNLFLRYFDVTTHAVRQAIWATPDALWREQPEGMFGPGELILHHIQSERFGAWFVPLMANGEELVLQEPFASVAAIENPDERMTRLRELNLKEARARLAKFDSLYSLEERWRINRTAVRNSLASIRPPLWDQVIVHPLVPGLSCDVATMCFLLFLAHPFYHSGQATTLMKVRGHNENVPFIFGTVPSPSL